MPKKKKNAQKEEDNNSSHEGRPSGLTLGDFIVKQAPPRKQNVPVPNNQSGEVESPCSSTTLKSNIVPPNVDDGIVNAPSKQLNCTEKDLPRYFICRTKKGGIRESRVENRSSGKKVTLIENVGGDGNLFVHDLKVKFGTGGLYKDGTIELQGDMKQKVTKYLNDNKDIIKAYGTK